MALISLPAERAGPQRRHLRHPSPPTPGTTRVFLFSVAVLVLLAPMFSARGAVIRQIHCQRMSGRCEVECLSFETKLGGCRSEMTPFCCKKRERN
ncbi:beta-defensin 107 [Molossus molossus]|uniref:beta-defensin 107 n=1 Tax=Molossus molossus TaxID=27622 RepID=UPI001747C879|nr:beta-defensin 107 [Molossus molossus]